MFEKLENSWNLVKAGTGVLKADKELVLFPALSGIALALVSLSFIAPILFFGNGLSLQNADIVAYIWVFLFYFVQYSVIFFFNSALVGARLDSSRRRRSHRGRRSLHRLEESALHSRLRRHRVHRGPAAASRP